MGYMTKKQIEDQKKKLTNVRDENTKLRRKLREMKVALETSPLRVDTTMLERKLKQNEINLAGSDKALITSVNKANDLRGRTKYLESVLKANILLIENLRTAIYNYKKLGFWGRVGMAFTSKEGVAKFFN